MLDDRQPKFTFTVTTANLNENYRAADFKIVTSRIKANFNSDGSPCLYYLWPND